MRRVLAIALALMAPQALGFAKRLNNSQNVRPGPPAGTVNIFDDDGKLVLSLKDGQVKWTPGPLPVCNADLEWTVKADVTTGTGTGRRTKLCLCTSDGAFLMPTYTWQNLATGTVGTATTCIVE